MSFFDHFLPRHVLYELVPYQIQNMWRQIKPRRHTYQTENIYALYAILPGAYQAPMDALLRGKLPSRYRYRHFTIPRRDGTPRQIAEPGVDLKAMQHAILKNILKRSKPHHAAVGYRKGMSIADHAWAHAGARAIITADIQDFFPSTTRYRVRQFWRSCEIHRRPLNDLEVQLLTNLTTYLGALPQGAPTSPALSNLVNIDLDRRLHQLAVASGGRYTRYVDDMVFSWQMRPRPPADFEFTVRRILREYGYRLHPRKGWHVWSREDEPEFTGVVLKRNGTVDVPQTMLDHMASLAQSTDEYDQFRLAGYEGYRQMIRKV